MKTSREVAKGRCDLLIEKQDCKQKWTRIQKEAHDWFDITYATQCLILPQAELGLAE